MEKQVIPLSPAMQGNAEDLSDKVMKLLSLSDKTTRIKMGQNARKFVESELNPEEHYQALMQIHQQAIDKH